MDSISTLIPIAVLCVAIFCVLAVLLKIHYKRIQSAFPGPSDECVSAGAKYLFGICSDKGQSVDIYDDNDELQWRLEIIHKEPAHKLLNIFKKPDLVLFNQNNIEMLRIHRVQRFPAIFEISESEKVIGTISLQSVFQNKYAIKFLTGESWVFRMPLYTTNFWAVSSEDTYVWAQIGSAKRCWLLLVEPGVNNLHLLWSLAFIHRQWWCYS